MRGDIRQTELFAELEQFYRHTRQPGTGQISDAAEIRGSPCGRYAVFAGVLMESLRGEPPTRIFQIELDSGDTRALTFGPNSDRLPTYSPDGRYIAFLSDRYQSGRFQLYLLDLTTGAAQSTPAVEGCVEYLQWSADGERILFGVAGADADLAAVQGAVRRQHPAGDRPSWMPAVEPADDGGQTRWLCVYDRASGRVRKVSCSGNNVWEAAWCGNQNVVAVLSPSAGEGSWYVARLFLVDVCDGQTREIHMPRDQIGRPSASPAGKHAAVIEALCSDRGLIAGDVKLIEVDSGRVKVLHARGVDISCMEWRSERLLLLAGHRGFETVVGLYDIGVGDFSETWSSCALTSVGSHAVVAPLSGSTADCVLVGEGYQRAPEIGVIRNGVYRCVKSFDLGYASRAAAIDSVECLTWSAPDRKQIQGWLLKPPRPGPYPVVMILHGGPVWHWRPLWLGRRSCHILMLLERGYAVFFPNPRGSTGRGQEFARLVVGDMGGADTYDCLSGLDYLVEQGIADRSRLAVSGGSYGGFLAAWLITQDLRFSAAIPVAPVTNHVTQQLISNIPHFTAMFLADSYTNSGGKYFRQSPVMHAHKVRTPTMVVCGGLDRCTPPEEARQFHNALSAHGVDTALITYPEEGHGVRKWPAVIDYGARFVMWIEKYVPTSIPTH